MSVLHTTLLGYLGKYITFKVPYETESNEPGFRQFSGKVISVCIELNGHHQLCVLHDVDNDVGIFYEFDEMIIQSVD